MSEAGSQKNVTRSGLVKSIQHSTHQGFTVAAALVIPRNLKMSASIASSKLCLEMKNHAPKDQTAAREERVEKWP